jgi:hypothetical protein
MRPRAPGTNFDLWSPPIYEYKNDNDETGHLVYELYEFMNFYDMSFMESIKHA